jgi:hypothetical protein
LVLDEKPEDNVSRLERVVSKMVSEKSRQANFYFDSKSSHPNAVFSNDNTLFSKKLGDTKHQSASTGKCYSKGKHFWLVKIIKSTSNYIMIGVAETLAPYEPFPGKTKLMFDALKEMIHLLVVRQFMEQTGIATRITPVKSKQVLYLVTFQAMVLDVFKLAVMLEFFWIWIIRESLSLSMETRF